MRCYAPITAFITALCLVIFISFVFDFAEAESLTTATPHYIEYSFLPVAVGQVAGPTATDIIPPPTGTVTPYWTVTNTATPTHTATPTATAVAANCDDAYPTVCIPPRPPDLNCGDISFRNFDVLPPDPHGFDGDNDGIGCES